MLQQVIHRACLASEGPYKIVACKNEVQYQHLTSDLSDMITQLWGLPLAKQRDLCVTIDRHAIRIALSLHGTYVCSKGYIYLICFLY